MNRCEIIAVCNHSGSHWERGCGRLAGVLQNLWSPRLICMDSGPTGCLLLLGSLGWAVSIPFCARQRKPGQLCWLVFASLWGQAYALTQTTRHRWGLQSCTCEDDLTGGSCGLDSPSKDEHWFIKMRNRTRGLLTSASWHTPRLRCPAELECQLRM